MNIALSSLLLILLILPGIIIRYFCRRGFWKSPVSLSSPSNEIFYGIIFSLCLHFLIYRIICITKFNYDFNIILAVMTGTINTTSITYISENIHTHFTIILFYFIIINLLSMILGITLNITVRFLKLDLKFKLFRFNNEWFYILSGEESIISEIQDNKLLQKLKLSIKRIDTILDTTNVCISAIVDHNSNQYIYWGYVSNFYFNKKGELDRIFLKNTHRRNLNNDKEDNTKTTRPPNDKRFYKIHGDFVIFKYSDLKTLNVHYLYLYEDQA